MLRTILCVLVAALLPISTVGAMPITRTFEFSLTGWFDDPPTPPVDPLIGSVTVTFDPLGGTVVNQTTGITLNSLNFALGSPIAFSYVPLSDATQPDNLFIGGLSSGAGSVAPGTNDFNVLIRDASTDAPYFFGGNLSTTTSDVSWRSDTGSVNVAAVAEPASLALMSLGLAGLGFIRKRKAA